MIKFKYTKKLIPIYVLIPRRELKPNEIGWEFNPSNPPIKMALSPSQFRFDKRQLYFRYINKATLEPFSPPDKRSKWMIHCNCNTCKTGLCWVERI